MTLILGLGATAGLYILTIDHERDDLRSITRLASETFRADALADLEFETTGLVRLALLGGRIRPTDQFWVDNAVLFMERRPGCIAVEVLGAAGQTLSLVYSHGNQQHRPPLAFDGRPEFLMKAAAQTDAPVLSGFVAVGGMTQRVTVLRLSVAGTPLGFLAAFFDVQRSFDAMFQDIRHLGFTVAVREQHRDIYSLSDDVAHTARARDAMQIAQVTLPHVVWELVVWPQPGTLQMMHAKLPDWTLMVGVLISGSLAVTVQLACRARAQSRTLRRATARLSDEIRAHQQAEQDLRRVQEDLDRRVRQRTAELSAANVRLQRETAQHARAEETLRELTGQLFRLQDEERRRLARELHDGATQNLIALGMNMTSLKDHEPDAESRKKLLLDCIRLIQQSVRELRTTSHLLHPPLLEELGLPVVLRSYVEGFSARSGIQVGLTLDGGIGRLAAETELGVFRIVQECLTNIHRHARTQTASIALCRESGCVRLQVSDAGAGIPPEILECAHKGRTGVGIAGMRERVRLLGGTFQVQTGDGGTTITITLPVIRAEPAQQSTQTAAIG